MRLAHLRLLGGNGPDAGVQVKLFPLGAAQFPRTHEHVRRQFQRPIRHALTLIAIDSAEERADLARIGDRAIMGDGGIDQRSAQVAARIRLQPGRRHGIAKDCASELHRPPRTLQFPFGFYLSNRRQHVNRFDLVDGHFTDGIIQQA